MQTELSELVPNLKVLYQIMNEVNDKEGFRSWLYVDSLLRRIPW